MHKGAIVGNLLWVCHVMFLHYRYTMDSQTLVSTTYPLLHGAVAYYLHILTKGKNNQWHLPPTASPEYKVWAVGCVEPFCVLCSWSARIYNLMIFSSVAS